MKDIGKKLTESSNLYKMYISVQVDYSYQSMFGDSVESGQNYLDVLDRMYLKMNIPIENIILQSRMYLKMNIPIENIILQSGRTPFL